MGVYFYCCQINYKPNLNENIPNFTNTVIFKTSIRTRYDADISFPLTCSIYCHYYFEIKSLAFNLKFVYIVNSLEMSASKRPFFELCCFFEYCFDWCVYIHKWTYKKKAFLV